jgi:uncharacterized protein YebE (UPF0316 family)
VIWQFLIIFIAKVIEVSLSTIRTVFVTRGEKLIPAIIAFFEIMIWLNVVSAVITGISESPARMMAYALGYSCGVFIGVYIEEKLAIGLITINVVLGKQEGIKLAQYLRENKVGVTELEAKGKDEEKTFLLLHVQRKNKENIIKLIKNQDLNALISVNAVKNIYGGFGLAIK